MASIPEACNVRHKCEDVCNAKGYIPLMLWPHTHTHTHQTKYYTHIKVKQDKNKNSVNNYESRTQFCRIKKQLLRVITDVTYHLNTQLVLRIYYSRVFYLIILVVFKHSLKCE